MNLAVKNRVIQKIFSIVLVFAGSYSANAALLSRTVGQVKDQIITSREVMINSMVEQALYSTRSVQAPSNDFKSKEFEKALNSVLLEWIVYNEAEAFSIHNLSDSEVQTHMQKVTQACQNVPLWKTLAPSTSELREVIRRKTTTKKFIQFKAQSSAVPVTDLEAREYFDNNKSRFGNADFGQMKENIKTFLSRQQVDERIKNWFDILQTKYKVRNFLTE